MNATATRPSRTGRVHDWGTDLVVADRVRSELGPLVKALDQPRIHVGVADGTATLHGDVADLACGAAIEARVLAVAGVRDVRSRLHVGLLRGDSRRSRGGRRCSAAAPRRDRRAHGSRRRIESLTARDVMTTDPVTIDPTTSVFAALEALTTGALHHLPVVDAAGRCIAVVDTTAALERLPDTRTGRLPRPRWRVEGEVGPLSVLAETPLRRVAAELDNAGVDACCVVDRRGRFLGLITLRDVVAAVAGRR